jgi:membrane-associated phospholipid phosphatase
MSLRFITLLSIPIVLGLACGMAWAQGAATSEEQGLASRFNPGTDLVRATRTFVTDAAHIYTFPVHMSRRDGLILGGVLAATALTYVYDQEIRDAVHRNEESDLLSLLRETGDFFEPVGHMGNTNVWYLGGAALSFAAGQPKATMVFVQILESHYIAGLGKNAIQYFVRRPRPFQNLGPREFGTEDATSFPSGHASNIFQVAAVLSHHADRKWASAAVYTIAGSVALQRIRSDMHWPSDVLLSSFYGWSVAKGVLRLHEGRKAAVTPLVSEMGIGLQVAFGF